MSKLLSYAGVSLNLSTPELEQRLTELHPQHLFRGWSGWNFDGFDLQSLPTPELPRQPEFRIGVLHWPTGATNPAWFHEIVSSKRLNLIRDALGSTNGPASLTAFDGRSGKTISARMYMLPALPLGQLGDDLSDSWLLTLTDIRFYFQWRRGTIGIPSSWAQLYSQLADILGITLTPDTVHSSYFFPSEKWAGYRRPTGTVLDAVATQVGQRVVANLDGTFKTVNWQTAQSLSNAYFENSDYRALSGGFIDASDIARYVPASVNVSFSNSSSGATVEAPVVVNKTLVSLGISDYGSAVGIAATAGEVFADYTFNGFNTALLDALATQAASDWYGWRLCDLDVVLAGIEPWEPTGWEDYVEWTFQKRPGSGFASTFLHRQEWDQFVSGGWIFDEDSGFGPGSGSGGNPCANCFPESGSGGDGNDITTIVDVICENGNLYVIRGKQAIVNDTATDTIRIEYYDITWTIEGCCDCSGSGSGSGNDPQGTIQTTCCPDLIPSVLYVRFHNATGTCGCLDNAVVPIAWTGVQWQVTTTDLCGGVSTDIRLFCVGAGWNFNAVSGNPGACNITTTPLTAVSCPSPFTLTGTGLTVTGCCNGTVDVTVTAVAP